MARSATRSIGDLVSHTIDSIVNGVSQQPSTLRLPSQGEDQVNMVSTVVDGVARRPGSEFKTTLHSSALDAKGHKFHIRSRDGSQQHVVLVEDGDVRVWNINTGVEALVTGAAVTGALYEFNGTRTDKTTEANEDTADDLVMIGSSATNSGFWFCSDSPWDELELVVTTPGAGTYAIAWEYSDAAATFASLTVADASGSYKNAAGTYSVTFTPPTDWTSTTYEGITGYWIRARWTSGTITTVPRCGRAYIGSKSYLDIGASSKANDAFAILSVADYSFIANNEVTVAKSSLISPAARPNEFMIYAFESTISGDTDFYSKIGSNSITLTNFNVVGSGTAWPGEFARTLLGEGTGDPYPTATYTNWTFSIPNENKNVFYGEQTGNTGSPEIVYAPTWEYSDETYSFIYEQTQKFSDLPARAVDGFVCEITGTDGNQDNNYYVKYDGTTQAWVECPKHGIANTLDSRTMPHTLVQSSIGGGPSSEDTFVFAKQAWTARGAGDTVTAPDPPFVGLEISDVVFHKNRLGFTSDENITLSETGEFFNFYPTTVSTIVDSDPIYAANTNNAIALIDFAIPFFGKLFTFSGHAGVQNVLDQAKGGSGATGLTNVTAEVTEASRYHSSSACRPVSAGQAVYFVQDRGDYSSLMEYTVRDNIADAVDISSHVPKYLPANIFQITASDILGMVVMISSDTANQMFVYNYLFDDGKRVQSAFHKWTFDDDNQIIGAEFVGEVLYFATKRTDGLHLEAIDFGATTTGSLGYVTHLDCQETVTPSYAAGTNLTTFTMSHAVDPATYDEYVAICTGPSWGNNLGQVLPLTFVTGTESFTVEGDWDASTVTVGKRFTHTYEFTSPQITETDPSGSGVVPVTQGRLQVSRFKTLHKNSGGFEARVLNKEIASAEVTTAEDAYVYEFPDKYLDSGIVDVMHPKTEDEFRFDVGMEGRHARVIITGNSHLPCAIVGAEWEGIYSRRNTRI